MSIERPSSSSRRANARLDGYVLAASVVDTFQPEHLTPVPGFEGDLGKLLDLSVASEREDGSVEWRLPNDVRRSALQVLASQERLDSTLEASRSASGSESPYQRMFEQYLSGNSIPLETQDLEQLQASLNAVKLLHGVVPNLPDASEIRAALMRQDFISQFELLAGRNFVGREEPLKQLRDFVDVLPQGMMDTVRRAGTRLLGNLGIHRILHEVPLMITGMGGMGKSALLSKFVLEHLKAASTSPDFLFAYIDFDKPGIWPDQPLTVLAEIAQQLALQVPNHAASFQQLNAQVVAELAVTTSYSGDFDSAEALLNLGTHGQQLSSGTIKDFSAICHSALDSTTRKTLLLVLDTFEEVSQRSIQHQEQLLRFVGDLQLILPRLRVVISGRGMHADIEEQADADSPKPEMTGLVDELARAVKPLELKELSEPEALHLLEALASPNPRLNKAIVGRVGGHPLSLKLAAQLVSTVARKLDKPPTELTAADLFGKQWLDHMSEGLLYRRIIAHISDEPLQKLADPGLVLRELTADIIFSVLNEPCRLGLHTSNEAHELFGRLKQFNQLVSIQSATVVRHRPELRQRVLKEMMYGQLELCRDIWFRAARYYQNREEGRIEELYCRLMLDEDTEKLAGRWHRGLEKSLLRSRAEMPVRARQFLDLMALTSDGRAQAGEAPAGELDVVLLAEEMKLLLSRGSANEALDLFRATISGRVPRYDSALYSVFVRAIAQSGDLDAAMTMSLKALDRLANAEKSGGPRYEELLLLCCQVTRAQHAAKAGTLRFVLRRALRRAEPMRAGKLVERFLNFELSGSRPVAVLRIAIALLELLDAEATDKRVVDPSGTDHAQICATRGWIALRKLDPDYSGVDGGLLVRSLAWLSAHFSSAPELQALLGVPQLMAILHRDYGESLSAYLEKRKTVLPAELVARFGAWRVQTSTGFEVGTLTEGQMSEVGAALRAVIHARDNAQGSTSARDYNSFW